MKTFVHDEIELPPMIRHDYPFRVYETPNGDKYPSATTILGKMKDQTELDAWKERVGHEEAERIKEAAASRGSEMHEMCEKTVMNLPVHVTGYSPTAMHLFSQVKPALERSVNNVRVIEKPLWSDKYKIAGTADLIADWDDVPSIIDYKTSLKTKRAEWIADYFMQTALYSCMFHERTGLYYKQIVIVIGVENTCYAQIFKADVDEWFPKAKEVVRQYHEIQGR